MQTITYGELLALYATAGVPMDKANDFRVKSAIDTWDVRYALPTQRWIEQRLGPMVGGLLDQTGIKYAEEQFDCEDFAVSAWAMSKWCWAITSTAGLPAGLAFGFWGYVRSVGGGHGINTAVHQVELAGGGVRREVAFYEPQPSRGAMRFRDVCLRRVTLNQEEIASCVRGIL